MVLATNFEVKSTCRYCGVGCGFILSAENGRLVDETGGARCQVVSKRSGPFLNSRR
jgi:predicted molibdopterin-dependent oxidoreductase YjgC